MCARYSLRPVMPRLLEWFDLDPETEFEAQSVVAPTNVVPVVLARADGTRGVRRFRWGLLGPGESGGTGHINARSETVFEKPSFRESAQRRRCLMPATAFFEWGGEGKARRPYRFEWSDGAPLAFAAIWSPPAAVELPATCCLLTTNPNALVARIHDRMPVILDRDACAIWLDPDAPRPLLEAVCRAADPERMAMAEATREETLPPRGGPDVQGSLF